MNKTITLADGRELNWDQFTAMTEAEQNAAFKPRLMPSGPVAVSPVAVSPVAASPVAASPVAASPVVGGLSLSKSDLLPRIRAAAESNQLSEDDVLAFIKIMHDIFFTAGPIAITKATPQPIAQQNGQAKGFQAKPVLSPAGRFESIGDATRYYKAKPKQVRQWILQGDKGFYFIH
jgi:hypothetical protein